MSKDKSILRKAAGEEVEMCFAIKERYEGLMGSWLKIKGAVLKCPQTLKSEALLWRRMLYRFGSGDFRCTDDECVAMCAFAQWTVDQNNILRNQPVTPIPRRK